VLTTTVSFVSLVPTKASKVPLTRHSDTMLKQVPFGRLFKQVFSVLHWHERTFSDHIPLNGQFCRSPPTAFQTVFISLGFKLHSRNGNLIRVKFLGLGIFIKDSRLCLGKVPHCIERQLPMAAKNTLRIGIRDDLNGKTKTAYLTLNNKSYKVTLPLTRRSNVKKIRLGSHRAFVYMTMLGVVFSNKGSLFPVTYRLSCRPKNGMVR
jgi:hypothetical protein